MLAENLKRVTKNNFESIRQFIINVESVRNNFTLLRPFFVSIYKLKHTSDNL